MNLLKKLAVKNLKLNKKRTIVTIIGIILSVALITAVTTMYASAVKSLINFEVKEKGHFHVGYYDVPANEVNKIKNNRNIEEIYMTQNIGYSKLKDSKNNYKPYAFVIGFTESAINNLSVKLVEGRFPENEDEILIPTHLKTNGRVELKVGETINLNIGTRMLDGYELNQNNPYQADGNETIENTISKTYKIVGIIERPASSIENYSAPGYTFITYMSEERMSGNVDVFCKYTKKSVKDYYTVTANILGVDRNAFEKIYTGELKTEEEYNKCMEELSKAKYTITINGYLIDLETNPIDNNTVGGLGRVVVIVCVIIIVTSVFCIKNSFDISISEKIKQYGILKSIGATKKQIRKNVFFEATILGLIGIPLGIISGMVASAILIVVSNLFMNNVLTEGLKLVFAFSPIAILIAIGLSVITIYLSALRSAIKASKTSPIESIRNSSNIIIKAKKIKCPKIINKIFGIGGEISYKNLKRNKKKYRTTVISIIVSVIIFIALSYFMSLAFAEVRNELKLRDYNLSLSVDYKGIDEKILEKINEVTRLENIKEYSIVKDSHGEIIDGKYNNEYKDKIKDNLNEDGKEKGRYTKIISLNKEQYEKFLKKEGCNYDTVKDKVLLYDKIIVSEGNIEKGKNSIKNKQINIFDYKKDDKLTIVKDDEIKVDIELGARVSNLPFGMMDTGDIYIIMSEETFNKYFETYIINVYFDSSNAGKLQDNIDELFKDLNYDVNNIEENVRIMKNLFTLVGIFLYGFIIVITLIGVTNIFNTITTNMELRKPEFAMLKSVGMTTKEFNRMIRLETVFMGIKSLVFSIPVGIGLSYWIYTSLRPTDGSKFMIPFIPILLSIVAVFLLITLIMKYSMSKINKQNTIETIRNENI